MPSGTLKARTGVSEAFWFRVPVPYTGTPTLTVRHPTSGDISPSLSAVHATTPITAYAADRRTLTVTSIGSSGQGLAGDVTGDGFVVSDAAGWFPARLRQIASATSFILAEALPMAVAVGSGDYWQWATVTGSLSNATITATASETPIPFTVAYVPYHGVDAPVDTAARFEGLLHVVRQPFDTGLDDAELVALWPRLAAQNPRRHMSWLPRIDLAEETLWRWLRRDLKSDEEPNVTEDDVSGPPYLPVHAAIVAAMVLRGAEGVAAMEDAERLYADVMADIPWHDKDADGAVDPGEANIRRRIAASALVRSLYDGSDSDFSATIAPDAAVFTRGMRH